MIKDLKCKIRNLKLLEENVDGTLFDINHKQYFFNLFLKTKEIKAKTNKWNLIKLKSFCTTKETTDKMKREPTEREKIFANNMTDKGLISRTY